MTPRWWPAPAKLNLFLHVTGRRADGYHDLQTAFQLLDYCDQLAFDITDAGAIERVEGPASIPAAEDLCLRAACLLQQSASVRQGVRIRLRKVIPAGGGLGGGSSDAATVLRVLNRLWGAGLTLPELAALGLQLGADVPVFVLGSSAWAEGRGERLQPLALPEHWYLVIDPGIAVSTARIFQAPELTRNSPLITIRAFSPAETRNDCEPAVRARHPEVGAALDWLARFAPARLTGTGACVFAGFARAADAEQVCAQVPSPWRSFVARGLQESPLQQLLRESG